MQRYTNTNSDPDFAIGGVPDAPPCVHAKLLPCWDGVAPEHHGLEATATSFWCEACGTPFTPFEAARLRQMRRERAAAPNRQAHAA
jgi:hypothetical protein